VIEEQRLAEIEARCEAVPSEMLRLSISKSNRGFVLLLPPEIADQVAAMLIAIFYSSSSQDIPDLVREVRRLQSAVSKRSDQISRAYGAEYAAKAEVERLREELSALKTTQTTCTWTHEMDEWEDDYWHTECGEDYELFDGGPTENGMLYCHHCGGRLVEVYPAAEEEKADNESD